MDYNKRIGDDFLRGDHLDGEVLQHTELNELENVAKTAINANYEDIQKLQNGVITVGNSEMIDGATLSSFEEETLQNSDTKVPTSAQVKNYVDAQVSAKQDILVSGTNIKTINDTSLLGSGNISITVPTKTSDLDNDSGFITSSSLPDLTNYVKNTDYATASKAGVIKSGYYGLQVDSTNGKAYCDTYTYANYGNVENQRFISKGTLENVITGKGLINSSYHDSTKQDTLVSGTNIKTVNNQSLLGSGNITIQGGGDATDVQINGVSITSDGVANINYASGSTGGVFKIDAGFGTSMTNTGFLRAGEKTYEQYQSSGANLFISKGTLENVLNTRIGLIDDYLDDINGEVI